MKRIAIIGAGNAGCITALELSQQECEITIYHSPEEHPIEKVGQGTFPSFPETLYNTLNIDWHNNPIDATFKTGILYEGWGKKQDEIFHSFATDTIGMHFVPQKLSNLVLKSDLVKTIEKTISDPEKEIDADYIFDCRGRHNRNKDLYEPLINPINSVLLTNEKGRDTDLIYTRTVATPNGWIFIIPNKESVSYGYLYNNTITSKEDASKDFLDRFDLMKIDHDLTFENYVAKDMFIGERTILQGNAYGFLEPLEATAVMFYQELCNQAIKTIFYNKNPLHTNNAVKEIMKKIETFILWHYQFGSKYNTPFWDYAKSLPFNPDEQFKNIINNLNNKDYYCWYTNKSFKIWNNGVI